VEDCSITVERYVFFFFLVVIVWNAKKVIIGGKTTAVLLESWVDSTIVDLVLCRSSFCHSSALLIIFWVPLCD
jgi:hypothetical protein